MQDKRKTKAELLTELLNLRRRVSELELAAHQAGLSGEKNPGSILQALKDNVVVLDSLGHIVYINHVSPGLMEDEVLGSNWLDWINALDRPLVLDAFHRTLQLGEPAEIEYQAIGPDRQMTWFQVNFSRLAGSPDARIVLVARDMTERKLAEERLRASEQHLRNTIDAIPNILWTARPDGYIDYCNHNWLSFTGLTHEQVQGTGWMQALHPEDVAHTRQAWDESCRERKPYEVEQRLRRFDGEYRWFLTRANPVMDASGIALKWYGSNADITERQAAEIKHRQSEEKFQKAFHTSPDSININRLEDGLYIDINQGFLELTGYTAEEVLGKTSQQINTWADPRDRERLVTGLRERGEVFNLEASFRIKNGQTKRCLMSARVLEINGEVCILSITRDISERILADVALRESEARYRLISENAADVIWVLNPLTGKFTYVSPSVEKLRGYTPAEVMQQPVTESLTPESLAIVSSSLATNLPAFIAMGSGTISFTNEVDQPRKDGSIVHTEVTTTYLFNERGEVEIVGVSRDITARKQAEDQLKKSLAEKDTLLRELYHRTKNNMGVINAILGLQASYLNDENLQKALEETQGRICSMSLVHQKLYETRDLSHINLKEYILELIKLISDGYSIKPGKVTFVADMEDVFVLIDTAIPCGLILNELFTNAFKYAFPAERVGQVKTHLRRLENGEIELGVADNGVGLPAGFDPRQGGSMGLQIIFALAENQLKSRVVDFKSGEGVSCHLVFQDNLYHSRV